MNTQKLSNLRWMLVILLAGVLAGCATLQPGPRILHLSETKLAAMIGDQFPFNSRYLELFDVVLERPQVRLMPAENRIGTAMGYRIGASLLGMPPTQGTLDLSYSLRFEPTDQTVRLTQVRVDRFDVPGVAPAYATRVNRLGAVLAEQLLRDFVIHRVKPEDLRSAQGWGYEPGALQVVPGGLRLQLEPVQRR